MSAYQDQKLSHNEKPTNRILRSSISSRKAAESNNQIEGSLIYNLHILDNNEQVEVFNNEQNDPQLVVENFTEGQPTPAIPANKSGKKKDLKDGDQGGSTKNPKHLPSKTTREKMLEERRKKTNSLVKSKASNSVSKVNSSSKTKDEKPETSIEKKLKEKHIIEEELALLKAKNKIPSRLNRK